MPNKAGVSIVCLLGHMRIKYVSHKTERVCCVYERAVGLYYVHKRVGVSIVCLTGQGHLLCASQDRGVYSVHPSWDTWYLICTSHGFGCLFCASLDTRYLMCASHGSGCLFYAQQGRGIYCVPHRTGVSIVCFLGHRLSNMCLTWQRVFIVYPTGQGYLLCASQNSGVY